MTMFLQRTGGFVGCFLVFVSPMMLPQAQQPEAFSSICALAAQPCSSSPLSDINRHRVSEAMQREEATFQRRTADEEGHRSLLLRLQVQLDEIRNTLQVTLSDRKIRRFGRIRHAVRIVRSMLSFRVVTDGHQRYTFEQNERLAALMQLSGYAFILNRYTKEENAARTFRNQVAIFRAISALVSKLACTVRHLITEVSNEDIQALTLRPVPGSAYLYRLTAEPTIRVAMYVLLQDMLDIVTNTSISIADKSLRLGI